MKVQSISLAKGHSSRIAYKLGSNNTSVNRNYSDNPLVDKYYGNVFALKTNKISFKGELVAQSIVSKQLNAVWSKLKRNEIAIITDDFDKTIKELNPASLDALKFIAKKVFVIKDSKFEDNLIAYKNIQGEKKLLNLGKLHATITDKEGKCKELFPFTPETTVDGDKIFMNGSEIDVNSNNISDKTYNEVIGKVESYPLTTWDPHCIGKMNKRHMEEVKTLFSKPKEHKITFSEVGGQAEVIKEIQASIIAPLRYPEVFNFKSGERNCGAVFYGPPGTGKTLLAKATANEVNMKFMKIDANAQADKYVGESEKKWRGVFDKAIENQPCIVFIDEADSVLKERGGSDSAQYDNKIVDQILTKMDEITYGGHNVYVILATNKIELLDPAILRSQRFGKHIEIKKPDLNGCRDILRIRSEGKPLDKEVDMDFWAKRFHDAKCTGSDFPFVLNDAFSRALQRLKILDKMIDGTFDKERDMKDFSIKNIDMEKAFDCRPSKSKDRERIPINGFRSANEN